MENNKKVRQVKLTAKSYHFPTQEDDKLLLDSDYIESESQYNESLIYGLKTCLNTGKSVTDYLSPVYQ